MYNRPIFKKRVEKSIEIAFLESQRMLQAGKGCQEFHSTSQENNSWRLSLQGS